MVPVSTFPLLRLPSIATMNTLRIMDFLQLFDISFASKKTKGLVQSLKIEPSEFTVFIDEGFSIRLKFPDGFLKFLDFKPRPNCLDFHVDYKSQNRRQSFDEMNERTLLDHLKFIFNTAKFDIDYGFLTNGFDFEPILKGRKDIGSICITTEDEEEERRVLDIIKPSRIFTDNLTFKDVLLQNLDSVRSREWKANLDNLLLTNSRHISNGGWPIPKKLVTRFLKLWTGGSNLRLESVDLWFKSDEPDTEKEIFNGLKTTQNNTKKYFKSGKNTYMIGAGTDIARFDGTKATILLHNETPTHCFFFMYVWHDHCTAEESAQSELL